MKKLLFGVFLALSSIATGTLSAQVPTRSILFFTGTYSSTASYYANDEVSYLGGFYISKVSANSGNTPSSSPAQWVLTGDPAGLAASLSATAQAAAIAASDGIGAASGVQANLTAETAARIAGQSASITGIRKAAGSGSADTAALAGTDYVSPAGLAAAIAGVATAPAGTGAVGVVGGVAQIANAHLLSISRSCVATSGSHTAYACSTTPSFTPVVGDHLEFESDVNNTGAATLAVNGNTAYPIKKVHGTANLVANDIQPNGWIAATFDGTFWQLEGQLGNDTAAALITTNGQVAVNTTNIATNTANITTNAPTPLTGLRCGHGTGSLDTACAAGTDYVTPSQLAASGALTNIAPMGLTGGTGYTAFGDSITNATGATTQPNGFAELLHAAFGAPYRNFSQGGDWAVDLSAKVTAYISPTAANNPIFTEMIGTNDASYCSLGAACFTGYNYALTAALSWASIPNTSKVFGQAMTVVSGTWTADNTARSGLGIKGTTNGAVLTFTITTTKANQGVYFVWYGVNGNAGTATLTDSQGAVSDALTTQSPLNPLTTTNGVTAAPFGKRYVIPVAGTDTFTVTTTSATGFFEPLWAGIVPPLSTQIVGVPVVYAIDPIYSSGGGNTALINSYTTQVASIVAGLKADGVKIAEALSHNFVNTTTDMSASAVIDAYGRNCPASTSPGLHPNDCGHADLARSVFAVATPVVGSTVLSSPDTGIATNGSGNFPIPNQYPYVALNGFSTVSLPANPTQGEYHRIYNYGNTTAILVSGPAWTIVPYAVMPGQTGTFRWNGGSWNLETVSDSVGAIGNEETLTNATTVVNAYLKESAVTLSANYTFTIGSPQMNITRKCIQFIQNATGGFTVTPPSNISGFFPSGVGLTANKRSFQCYVYSTAALEWIADSPGVTNVN